MIACCMSIDAKLPFYPADSPAADLYLPGPIALEEGLHDLDLEVVVEFPAGFHGELFPGVAGVQPAVVGNGPVRVRLQVLPGQSIVLPKHHAIARLVARRTERVPFRSI